MAVAAGWVVYRAAGSHGNADLVALKRGHVPLLIQVKGSARGPFEHFRTEERYELMDEGRKAGARACLAWWPAHKPLLWFAAPTWEAHANPLP